MRQTASYHRRRQKYRDENESFGDHGFTEKEFVGEELEDVELDEEPDDSDLENLSLMMITWVRNNKEEPFLCQITMNNNMNR